MTTNHNPPHPGGMFEGYPAEHQRVNHEFIEWRFRRWSADRRYRMFQVAMEIGIGYGISRYTLLQIHTFTPTNNARDAELHAPLWVAYAAAAERAMRMLYNWDDDIHHQVPPPRFHETHCGSGAPEPAHNIINLTSLIQRFLPAPLQTAENAGAIMNIVAGALNAYRNPDGSRLTYGIQIDHHLFGPM